MRQLWAIALDGFVMTLKCVAKWGRRAGSGLSITSRVTEWQESLKLSIVGWRVRVELLVNKILANWDVTWLAIILIGAGLLRLFMFADFNNGSIRFVGACGQLLDEVKPLVEA